MMEWTEKIRSRLNDVTVQNSLRIAALSVLPDMRVRIFDKGLTPEGNSIGNYSTKPTYLSIEQIRKQVGGRPSRTGKSRYYPGGYAQYKAALGSKGFDLRNFGVMMRDFLAPQEVKSGTRLILRFKEKRNQEIAEKYPQAFGMSSEEKATFQKVFQAELTKALTQ